MQNLQEGNVGKIVRYKSGRTKLILGDAKYDLDLGLNSGFLQVSLVKFPAHSIVHIITIFQEIVSVNANREERSGNMVNLGQIEAKINVIPDWEYLFHKSAS
jgi:DNA-directed RNA polymerase III subunit RPC4